MATAQSCSPSHSSRLCVWWGVGAGEAGRQAAEGLVPSREPSGAKGARALGQELQTTRSLRDYGRPTAPRLLFSSRLFPPEHLQHFAARPPWPLKLGQRDAGSLCYVTVRRRCAVCKCLESDLVWLQHHRCEDKWQRGLECLSLKDVSLCWAKS